MRAAFALVLTGIFVSLVIMEKWFEIGKEIGLTGADLTDFIREREIAARDDRAQSIELRRSELELRQNEREIMEMQLRLQELKRENPEEGDQEEKKGSRVNSAKAPKLPVFDEAKDDLDAYLQRFERYATSQKWEEDHWAINLSALLRGKALDVYSRLPLQDASSYEVLKQALLKRFRMTEEGFRTKFRTAKPEFGETPPQFSVRLENYFSRWIELAKTPKTFEGVMDLLLREQFINSCSKELALFLKERQPKSIVTMTKLAEQYQEAHGVQFGLTLPSRRRPLTQSVSHQPHSSVTASPQQQQLQGKQPLTYREQRTCFICHRKGHIATDCRFKGSPAKVAGMMTAGQDQQLEERKRGWPL